MSNRDLILAGISGGGAAGNSLAYFAPTGSTAPTTATADPDAAFLDAGWVSENGLAIKNTETSKDVKAFGSFLPVRTIVTESKQEFNISFLESNEVTLSVYHRKPLAGTGHPTVAPTTGIMDFSTGRASTEQLAGIFDMVDGANFLRAYCPALQVTATGDIAIKAGEAVEYPVTFTAFPDETGASIYWFYLLAALITP